MNNQDMSQQITRKAIEVSLVIDAAAHRLIDEILEEDKDLSISNLSVMKDQIPGGIRVSVYRYYSDSNMKLLKHETIEVLTDF